MKNLALTVGLSICSCTFAFGQVCLHGPNQTQEQTKRERAALAVVRMINTMQAEAQAKSGHVLSQADLTRSVDPEMTQMLQTLQATFDKPEVLPGFELRVMSDARRYILTLTDTADPCHFSFVSDERGTITKGEVTR